MTVLSDQVQVLLREAKAEPDDDVPRLVLADWLQDQGDPRGELIALQMQRHRLAADDTRQIELARRERLLLRRYIFDWLGPLVNLVSEWRFERGLLHLEARAERLLGGLSDQPTIDAVLPWMERLRLTEARPGYAARIAISPLLDHLVCLDLADNRLNSGHIVLLARSPRLATLRRLNLRGNRVGADGGMALAVSPHLAGLRQLDLAGNPLDDHSRAALVARFGERVRFA